MDAGWVVKKSIDVAAAAITRDGCYLITQRMAKAVFPGLWEFPGGKAEQDEDPEVALRRELKYRLGIDATVGEKISERVREYDHYAVTLHLYSCDIGEQEPAAVEVAQLAWVSSDDMGGYDFVPADQESMDRLLFGES